MFTTTTPAEQEFSIVNVGQCHPLFGHSGGGEQIEFVSGPAPERTTVVGNWSDTEGQG